MVMSIISARRRRVEDGERRRTAILWTAHPRTKSSEGYPETYKDKDFFQSDRFIGASWESLPVDLSEKEAVRGPLLRTRTTT